ncbi:ubiquitin carboxyl-terminal hydrolase 8-like [Ornithodoros turicata]|uniref:ubiquitin carboxyl-terminal hydrolase 8-like n=1 Tax=Ornithodoros turicata TaxID=34597 RepID=UPI00313945A8
MPSTTKLTKLYLASSMEELQKQVDIALVEYKSITTICNSASKIRRNADLEMLNGDEEKAYIYYMRYFDLVQRVRKHRDYKKEKEKCDKTIELEKCSNVIERLELLKRSLLRRYALMKDATEAAARDSNGTAETVCGGQAKAISSNSSSQNESLDAKDKQISMTVNSKPSTPSIAPEKRIKTVITSFELYDLLLDRTSSVLIMDARPRDDFLESHLRHSRCINIPEEVLVPGTIASNLLESIPEESRSLYDKRDLMDFVILLDWRSKEVPASPTVPVRVLKDAICKWSIDKVLRSDPMVLHGGYEDWLLRYPTYTTYSQPSIPTPPRSPFLHSPVASDGLDYPDLDEAFLATPDDSPKLSDASGDGIRLPHIPSVDRSKKPSVATLPAGASSYISRLPPKVINGIGSNSEVPHVKKQPSLQVDRRLKPQGDTGVVDTSIVKPADDKNEASTRAQSLGQELLDLSQAQLRSEQEFELLRERRAREAEEASRAALQEEEETLREHIRHIEASMALRDKEMDDLLQQNELMKKQLQEKNLEEERKKASRELHRLREERKKKEQQAKEDSPKAKNVPTTSVPGASSAPEGTPLRPNKPTTAVDAVSDTTSPAKLAAKPNVASSARAAATTWSGSSGLSRSRSFPNLSTAIEEEPEELSSSDSSAPQFDRNLKPAQSVDSAAENLNRRGRTSDGTGSRVRSISPTSGQEFKHLAGLKNLGNTCYMNATLQCLANTLPLALHFLSGRYVKEINRESRRGGGAELAEEFRSLLSQMYYKDKGVAPKSFKSLMGRFYSVYAGHEQQDAHEFLLNLIDRLHEGLNRGPGRSHTKGFVVDENLSVNGRINQFWCHHVDRNLSVVSDLFEGLLVSTLTCLSCQKTSSSFEVFSCLSLPIPQHSSGTCYLQDCLKLFLEAEKMSGEAAWDCPVCKQKRKAEKRMIIARLPKILIIQFNRFRCEGAWQSKKLQTYVHFPISNFDMNEYVDHTRVETQRRPPYDLYAFLNHYGTLAAGHYIGYCRAGPRGGWYMYDDSSVSEVILSESDKRNAYILFYTSVDARHQFISY